jgi:hypothetical protein
MTGRRSEEDLLHVLRSEVIADLPTLQSKLGDASPRTVFRYLSRVPYRRSFNHNGRFYTLHDPARYDEYGLFSHGDIHFSVDGTLSKTVRRLVWEAEAGATQREIQDRLCTRVHEALRGLLQQREVGRTAMDRVYLYHHIDDAIAQEQRQCRQQRLDQARQEPRFAVSDVDVIRVLLVLLRYPGSRPQDVVRRLRGHEPPIRLPQIQAVFDRYDLGEKGGPAIF